MYRLDEEAMNNEQERQEAMQPNPGAAEIQEGQDPELAAEHEANQPARHDPQDFNPQEQKVLAFIVTNASKAMFSEQASADFLAQAKNDPAQALAEASVTSVMMLVQELQRRQADLPEDLIFAAMSGVAQNLAKMLVKSGTVQPQALDGIAQQALDIGHRLYLQLSQQGGQPAQGGAYGGATR